MPEHHPAPDTDTDRIRRALETFIDIADRATDTDLRAELVAAAGHARTLPGVWTVNP